MMPLRTGCSVPVGILNRLQNLMVSSHTLHLGFDQMNIDEAKWLRPTDSLVL